MITTIVTTIVFSLLFVFNLSIVEVDVDGVETTYNIRNQFFGWFIFLSMYVGVIILIYGNIVSIIIEKIQTKWFPNHNWLYILILGIFGLVSGFIFQTGLFALLGMLAAILYGIIDKWLSNRMSKNKSVKLFLIIPIDSVFLCWGVLTLISPPMPPFTKEDAIEFATSGERAELIHFPNKIGKWEGNIAGYQVIRETSVNGIGKEKYIVTFTESWSKGNAKGTRILAYKVKRGSLTMNQYEGTNPPYY